MKKTYYSLAIVAFIALVAMPAAIKAEIGDTATRTPLGAMPAMIREEIRTDFQQRQNNAKTNQNVRNNLLGSRVMPLNMFKVRQQNITQELQNALNNLTNIRGRIQSRIDKEVASGTDMTDAKTLLGKADAKIIAAQSAIDSISRLSTAGTINLSPAASTTVDLNKPRLMTFASQRAVKDAQNALNDVISAILKQTNN
jgi:hypothetical protein